METLETRLRVRYAETDQMGVVYYANYLIWMEVGRAELCRATGIRYRDMEMDDGVMLVVIEANCRYLAPARYDDEVTVRTTIGEATPRMVRFDYEVRDAVSGRSLATGFSKHVFCGRDMKPRKLPQKYWPLFGIARAAVRRAGIYSKKMSALSMRDLDLKGKRVFMRVDFNVPLAAGGKEITSDKRIQASLPSIRYALDHGAALILASHLGRPKGKPNPEMSLAPVAARLSALLGKPVAMAPDCVGPAVEAMLPKPGEVLLLENLRFHAGEEKNDPEFSRQLASLCDVYINDAFGSAHRAHASTVGMIRFVNQAGAGLLMQKELEYLTKVTRNPERPCVAILGGAKVSDKIEVIQNLMKVVDRLLIGGAMAYTFLRARGEGTGRSLVEEDKIELAKQLMTSPDGRKLMLPVDHVVASELKAGAASAVADSVPEGQMGLDVGPKTIEKYSQAIAGAKTIIWNGPMGVFEIPPFDKGTLALARAVAASGAVSVVGGGDSEKAIKSAGVADKISHISTGGGASLEFLAGIELPGVKALER